MVWLGCEPVDGGGFWVAIVSLLTLGISVLLTPLECEVSSSIDCLKAFENDQDAWKVLPVDQEPQIDHQEQQIDHQEQQRCLWKIVPGKIEATVLDTWKGALMDALEACHEHGECKGVVRTFGEDGHIVHHLCPSDGVQGSEKGEISYVRVCKRDASKDVAGTIPEEPKMEDWVFPGDEPTSAGYEIEGHPTILVSMASYRDSLCMSTINDALRRAKYPNRLIFAVVEQNLPIDEPCVPNCYLEESKVHPICDHLDQIRLHAFDARLARGPTHARHRADRLYRGESFVLQIDAHMIFTKNWDEEMIEQWNSAENEFAILTSYPTIALGSVNLNTGESLRATTPAMCVARLMPDFHGLVRFESASEIRVELIDGKPLEQPFWAAGLSFARGHRIINVPYDCCTPNLFQGEEFYMASRMYSHGYQFYSFASSLVYHYYPDERPKEDMPMFWENVAKGHAKKDDEQKSIARISKVLTFDLQSREFHEDELHIYALGSVRPVEDYFKLLGVTFNEDKTRIVSMTTDFCHDVAQRNFSYTPRNHTYDDDEDDGENPDSEEELDEEEEDEREYHDEYDEHEDDDNEEEEEEEDEDEDEDDDDDDDDDVRADISQECQNDMESERYPSPKHGEEKEEEEDDEKEETKEEEEKEAEEAGNDIPQECAEANTLSSDLEAPIPEPDEDIDLSQHIEIPQDFIEANEYDEEEDYEEEEEDVDTINEQVESEDHEEMNKLGESNVATVEAHSNHDYDDELESEQVKTRGADIASEVFEGDLKHGESMTDKNGVEDENEDEDKDKDQRLSEEASDVQGHLQPDLVETRDGTLTREPESEFELGVAVGETIEKENGSDQEKGESGSELEKMDIEVEGDQAVVDDESEKEKQDLEAPSSVDKSEHENTNDDSAEEEAKETENAHTGESDDHRVHEEPVEAEFDAVAKSESIPGNRIDNGEHDELEEGHAAAVHDEANDDKEEEEDDDDEEEQLVETPVSDDLDDNKEAEEETDAGALNDEADDDEDEEEEEEIDENAVSDESDENKDDEEEQDDAAHNDEADDNKDDEEEEEIDENAVSDESDDDEEKEEAALGDEADDDGEEEGEMPETAVSDDLDDNIEDEEELDDAALHDQADDVEDEEEEVDDSDADDDESSQGLKGEEVAGDGQAHQAMEGDYDEDGNGKYENEDENEDENENQNDDEADDDLREEDRETETIIGKEQQEPLAKATANDVDTETIASQEQGEEEDADDTETESPEDFPQTSDSLTEESQIDETETKPANDAPEQPQTTTHPHEHQDVREPAVHGGDNTHIADVDDADELDDYEDFDI